MDYKAATPKTVDGYLAALKPKDRKALQAVRRTIRAAAPEATEFISYGIPAFKYKGNLVSFAAFKSHLTLFAGTVINTKFAKDLKRFEQTKGGIHFTADKPIPTALITRIVKSRVQENEALAKEKKSRASTGRRGANPTRILTMPRSMSFRFASQNALSPD